MSFTDRNLQPFVKGLNAVIEGFVINAGAYYIADASGGRFVHVLCRLPLENDLAAILGECCAEIMYGKRLYRLRLVVILAQGFEDAFIYGSGYAEAE